MNLHADHRKGHSIPNLGWSCRPPASLACTIERTPAIAV
jgi:hypothetical protein